MPSKALLVYSILCGTNAGLMLKHLNIKEDFRSGQLERQTFGLPKLPYYDRYVILIS